MPVTRPHLGPNAVLLLFLVAGCQGADPTDGPSGAALAKGGGTAPDPTVTAVDPTSAPQDTTLDLRIIGSGYDRGSTARLLLAGQPVATVKTNSTKYVSATELVANITVELTAPVASYDVEVLTIRGRKGVGSELFAVKPKGNADLGSHANWTFYSTLSDGTMAVLIGDGRGLDGGPSLMPGESSYPGELCGVRGRIFNSGLNTGGDAVLDPDADSSPAACADRILRGNLGAGPVSLGPYINARLIGQMGENTQKVETLVLSNLGISTPCGNASNSRLEYSVGNGSGVSIRRLANENGAGVWIVETTGNHLAACIKWSKGAPMDSGKDVYLPFRTRVVEIQAPVGGW